MQNPLPVHRRQRAGYLAQVLHRLRRRDSRVDFQAEVTAADIFNGAVRVRVADSEIVDADDVRVVHPGDGLVLLEEAIKGLDAGADDYVAKPFDLDELAARVRAVIRRGGNTGNKSPLLKIGSVALSPASYKVTVDNDEIHISRREFAILHKLMECENRVVTREIITQSLYGWGDDVDSNTIEVHIHNLRKKIGEGLQIKTVRGIGYMIENESTESVT